VKTAIAGRSEAEAAKARW